MRGFKRDATETIARQYLDERSFVSMPKMLPDCPNTQHEILYGKDKGWQRQRLGFRAGERCERCKVRAFREDGEWSHKAVKPADRCDCIEAAEWLCHDCHAKVHAGRAPRWTKNSK